MSEPVNIPGAIVNGQCIKCNYYSGDSWSQCDGICPVPFSPHYKADALARINKMVEIKAELRRLEQELEELS